LWVKLLIPNLITGVRVVLAPVVFFLVIQNNFYLASVFVAVAAIFTKNADDPFAAAFITSIVFIKYK
jgi:uncharacterized membrane protein YqhA